MKNSIKLTALAILAVALFASKAVSKPDSDTLVLSKDNTLVLNTEVDGDSTGAVISKAKELDQRLSGLSERVSSKRPLYLFLSTPGGGIQSGLEMIEALQGLGRPVNTVTLFAASMGFQIVQNLDARLIIRNGVLMSHHAVGEFQGEFGGQPPSQVESRLHLWNSRVDELDKQTVKRTKGKQTLKSYQEDYAHELWLTGQQAVDQGYADKIVTVKCDSSLSGVTSHSADVMGMHVLFDLDNCPINTSPLNVRVALPTERSGFLTTEEFVKRGGQFGPTCLIASANNKTLLCALDTSLTLEKINHIKVEFVAQYNTRMRRVVDRF